MALLPLLLAAWRLADRYTDIHLGERKEQPASGYTNKLEGLTLLIGIPSSAAPAMVSTTNITTLLDRWLDQLLCLYA